MKVKKMFTVIALCLISVCSVFAQHRYDEDLLRACKGNSLRDVQKYLAAGADPNAWQYDGSAVYTALSYACKNGNINMVRTLVDSGASVDGMDGCEAPLLIAARNKNRSIVNYLIVDCKADANVQDSDGKSPLMYVISFGATQLAKNIIQNFPGCIDLIDVNSRNALHYACGYGTANKSVLIDLVSLLLGNGADPYYCDNTGTTPFMFCAINDQTHAVLAFLNESINFDPSRKNTEGVPALLECIKKGVSLNIIELVFKYCRNVGAAVDVYGDGVDYYIDHYSTGQRRIKLIEYRDKYCK